MLDAWKVPSWPKLEGLQDRIFPKASLIYCVSFAERETEGTFLFKEAEAAFGLEG
jgi:hypothetical protein